LANLGEWLRNLVTGGGIGPHRFRSGFRCAIREPGEFGRELLMDVRRARVRRALGGSALFIGPRL
jgi:hypothetical protein